MSQRTLPVLLGLLLIAMPAAAERGKLDGRVYYLHVPPAAEQPALFVWFHADDGRAKRDLKWWRRNAPAFGGAILLTPRAAGSGWSTAADERFVLDVIDQVATEHGVDRDRIVLGGHASGAGFVHELSDKHPGRFQILDSEHGLGTAALRQLAEILRPPDASAPAAGASQEALAPVISAEKLWQAAGEGDLATVETLLDQGVDVDARTRYQATALTFAAEKGHLEIVRRLLEHGAAADPKDTFYHLTPLAWALSSDHLEIARLLLEHGARDAAADALKTGVEKEDRALIQAAVDSGPFYQHEIEPLIRKARDGGKQEILALLESALLASWTPAEVDGELLESYAGTYKVANGPRRMRITLRDGELWAQDMDQEPFRLAAVDDRGFRVADHPVDAVEFYGRATAIEGLLYTKASFPLPFSRLTSEDEDLASPAAGEALPEAARTAPIQWPSFRGPNATGIADGQGAVAEWDVESSTNVRWKTEIPGLGLSSPIVWDDRVFVTTAVSASGDTSIRTGRYGDVDMVDDASVHSWQVLCLDKHSGEILWQRTAGEAVPATRRHQKSSQANSTPATDGTRVVAVFPTVGVFCYDFDGNLLWHQDLGALDAGWFYDASYQWGFASSPIFYRDLVILQVDVQEGAYITAFDADTGTTVWKTERDEIPTWATPALYLDGARDELIVNGTTIRGYDPANGQELWRLSPNSEVIIATPVVGDELVYVSAGYPPVRTIYAIRPGGSGDISLDGGATENGSIAWSYDRGGAYMPTPILYRGLFYIGHHAGRLAVYDAETGEPVYRARFSQGGTFTGSPVAADGKLYFSTEDGDVYVVKAGPVYEELAINAMDEVLMTTPAISDGAIFLRTAGHLYAIGESYPSP
ncbi:MAG: PQQ-binding-like beta-propeller repeat protein [Thermoanaerobaculia bacterium]